jgi:hypothetical protein
MKKTIWLSSVLLLMGWNLAGVAAPLGAGGSNMPTLTTAKPSDPQSKVELLDPGAIASRRVLRYEPIVGSKQIFSMAMDSSTKIMMTVGGNQVPAKQSDSSTTMKAEATITQVAANGDISYSFRYLDMNMKRDSTLPAEVLDRVRSQLKKLIGTGGTIVMNSQGIVKSVDLKWANGLDSMTQQLLNQISRSMAESSSFPLPDVAIGKGAKWRVTHPTKSMGITMNMSSTYELVEVRDHVVTLKVTYADQGQVKQLRSPMRSAIDIKSMSTSGGGQLILRLDRVLPQKSELLGITKATMEAPSKGNAAPIPATIEAQYKGILESL